MIAAHPSTILITGGSGFFGTNAAEWFRKAQGSRVVCTSSHPEKYAAFAPVHRSLQDNPLIKADVLDVSSLLECFEKIAPEYIIHAAAYSVPLLCEKDPEHTFRVNVGGTENILQAAEKLDIPLVFLSTDLVFKGDRAVEREGAYTELMPLDAEIVYGKSKIAAERVLQESSFRKWIILRTSLMFGGRVAWAKGFPQFAIDMLKTQQPATLFYDQYRTPTYIADIAEAIHCLVENSVENSVEMSDTLWKSCGKHDENVLAGVCTQKNLAIAGEIFHCGGAERMNRVEFVRRCCAVLGVDSAQIVVKSMNDVPDYTTRVCDVSLDSTKLTTRIQWKQTALESAFQEMSSSFDTTFDDK
ncbi:MAG: NAD-dependent epimerase/dehydratase family protein [Candidatus Kapaibacterium sp.]|nr:MAG: NAD-dependent epimerase/dehydratase family protein [Candidatus Kapabacteria bacterium]